MSIQGWLKSMNGVQNLASADIGNDGESIPNVINVNQYVARDAAAFSLEYFNGDYQSNQSSAKNLSTTNLPTNANLYNGNIAAISSGIYYFGALSKTYEYDYLNRILNSETRPLNSAGSHLGSIAPMFSTEYSYDLNGNILTLDREGNLAQGLAMDQLRYTYPHNNNRLSNVYDQITSNAYTNDFKNTSSTVYYGYDQMGNLISDIEGNTISWTPYGKVSSVVNANRTLNFGYAATGERVFKELNVGSHIADVSSEYYVRDASGNLMALYGINVQAANTSSNIQTINNFLIGLNPGYLQSLMEGMLQNRAFMQSFIDYIIERGWLAEYLAQSNLEISSFFAWNPNLIKIVFNDDDVRNYIYSNYKEMIITAINCDPVDLLTLILSDPDKGHAVIDLICQNGNYHGLMHELFNQLGVGSCDELKNILQTKARTMALVIQQFNDQQQPVLFDMLSGLFSDPSFFNHFINLDLFNNLMGTALRNCIDPIEFGNILNDYWGGDFTSFLKLVGEHAIIESLLLGNFEDIFHFITNMQSVDEIMTDIILRMQNFSVVEYMEWIKLVLGQSVYNQIMQMSPNILNFEKVITLQEQYIYGSRRLGVRKPKLMLAAAPHSGGGYQTPNEPTAPGGWYNNECNCYDYIEPELPGAPPASPSFATRFYIHELGRKEYELTNHLGNVLATVLDRKTGVKASPTATTYAWFKADVTSAQDYYPFGMQMPGRTFVADTTNLYRYGMNGQEKVDEIYGTGNSYTAEFWQYDARLGRRWNQDPKPNPSISNNATFANNPIWYSDPLGDTVKITHRRGFLGLGKKQTLNYEGGSLFNSDGTSYEGKVSGFLKQSMNALNDIRSTREGGSALEELESSKNIFTIVRRYEYNSINEDGQTQLHSGNGFNEENKHKAYSNQWDTDPLIGKEYDILKANGIDFNGGSGGIIYWNPKGGTSLKELGGGTANRPTVFLGHELFHARDANRGLMDNRPYLDLARSEWQASFSENIMRMQMGIPLRSHYGVTSILDKNLPFQAPK